MKQLFLCLLLGISPCLYAVNNLRLPGVRCMGMGECGVVQSVLFNPAVVALITISLLISITLIITD